MMLGVRFEMRLKIPGQTGQLRHVDFSAFSLWSSEDVTPGSYDTGFSLIDPPGEIREMIAALHHYFSFQPMLHVPLAHQTCRPRTALPTRTAVTASEPVMECLGQP